MRAACVGSRGGKMRRYFCRTSAHTSISAVQYPAGRKQAIKNHLNGSPGLFTSILDPVLRCMTSRAVRHRVCRVQGCDKSWYCFLSRNGYGRDRARETERVTRNLSAAGVKRGDGKGRGRTAHEKQTKDRFIGNFIHT